MTIHWGQPINYNDWPSLHYLSVCDSSHLSRWMLAYFRLWCGSKTHSHGCLQYCIHNEDKRAIALEISWPTTHRDFSWCNFWMVRIAHNHVYVIMINLNPCCARYLHYCILIICKNERSILQEIFLTASKNSFAPKSLNPKMTERSLIIYFLRKKVQQHVIYF